MKKDVTNNLIIAIGNSGRADDGLGWAFLDGLIPYLPSNWYTEYRYQLQIEDAELISAFDQVYFVDADTRQLPGGYSLTDLSPKACQSLTSHQLEPAAVLHLCQQIYQRAPKAFLIGIGGEDFRLSIGLSQKARNNLRAALGFFNEKVILVNARELYNKT
jgi:hydrogenase maturation protease